MNQIKKSYPYLWAVALAFVSFLASRGQDGHLMLFFVGFGTVGVGYTVTTLIVCDRLTWSFARHAAALFASAVFPLFIHNQLNEMGGLLNLFIPLGALAIVTAASVSLALKQWVYLSKPNIPDSLS